jgi:hypothetical protein
MGLVTDLNTAWALKHFDYLFTLEGAHVLLARGKERKKWKSKDPRVLAFTHGNTIVVRDLECLNMEIIKHEMEHIRQARAVGGDSVFIPAVMLSGVWAFVTRGSAYDNFFERRALLAEQRDL